METKSPPKHPLWHLLKGCLKLSDERLSRELDVRGHEVTAKKLSSMLRGVKPMPPEIEKALKHIGAEQIEERVLDPEAVGEVIEPWYRDDDESDEDAGEGQHSARENDRLYDELLEGYDDPKRLGELVTEFEF